MILQIREKVNKAGYTALLLSSFLLINSCGKNGHQDQGPNQIDTSTAGNDKYSFVIPMKDTAGQITVTLNGEETENNIFSVKKILIFRKDSLAQSFENTGSQLPSGSEIEYIVTEDMNFDGFNDFRVIRLLPAAPNIPYIYFFFDPDKNLFYRNYDFEMITSPQFDKERKQVTSSWRGSPVTYGTDFYEVRNNKPVLVKQVIDERNEDGVMMRKTYISSKGEMKMISDEPVNKQ